MRDSTYVYIYEVRAVSVSLFPNAVAFSSYISDRRPLTSEGDSLRSQE